MEILPRRVVISLFNQSMNESSKDDDFIQRTLKKENVMVSIYYLKSVIDDKKISEQLISYFYRLDIRDFESYLQSFPDFSSIENEDSVKNNLLNGFVVISIKHKITAIGMKKFETRPISEVTTENVISGSQVSINEDLDISLNMIRNRYRSESLRVSSKPIGEMKSTIIAILYDDETVDRTVLEKMQDHLDDIPLFLIPHTGQLLQKLTYFKWKKWLHTYPNVQFKVNTKLVLKYSGAIR